jgi:hypothetical protein
VVLAPVRARRDEWHNWRRLSNPALTLDRSSELGVIDSGSRNLEARPFADWEDLLEALAAAARDEPLLLILDEFPDLTAVAPDLAIRIRPFWDRARGRTKLRLLLCGSAALVWGPRRSSTATCSGSCARPAGNC